MVTAVAGEEAQRRAAAEGASTAMDAAGYAAHYRTVTVASKKPLVRGACWYLVSVDWWKRWEVFVKAQSGDVDCEAVGDGATEPGPVNNDLLLEPCAETGLARLKSNLIEDMDFKLVPRDAWLELTARFGVEADEHELARAVIESGLFTKQAKVELYPLELRVRRADSPAADVRRLVISRAATLGDLRTRVRDELGVEEAAADERCLIYGHLDESGLLELVDVDKHGRSSTLETHLSPNQLLLLDVLDGDGKSAIKPEQIASAQTATATRLTKPALCPGELSAPRRVYWALLELYSLLVYVLRLLCCPLALLGGGWRVAARAITRRLRLVAAIVSGRSPTAIRYRRQSANSAGSSSSGGGGSSFFSLSRPLLRDRSKPGLCGLQNLGNTCFMNSALQCLSNTPKLCDYFLSGDHMPEINKANPLGLGGRLAVAYGELMRDMWSGQHSSVLPRQLKMIIGQFAPQFSGYQQQDSQELLAFLLDGLHEDLNRILKKPYIEEKHADGRDDETAAAEAWAAYEARNDSIVVDTFHGQIKSTLVCPDCAKVSVKFDPFCYLSLPVPQHGKQRRVQVTLVPADPALPWLRLKVVAEKGGTIRDVADAMRELVDCSIERLLFVEVLEGRPDRTLSLSSAIYQMVDSDRIFAYEVEAATDDEPTAVIIVQQRRAQRLSSQSSSVSMHPTGFPFVFRVAERHLTVASLYESVVRRVQPRFANMPDELARFWEDGCADGDEIKDAEEEADSGVEENGNGNGREAAAPFDLAILQSQYSTAVDALTAERLRAPATRSFFSAAPNVGGRVLNIALVWNADAFDAYVSKQRMEFASHESMAEAEKPPRPNDLSTCLGLYTRQERLGEHDPWYCPQCKVLRRASKKLDLWRLPPVLIIHLKRFSYNRYFRDKIETVIDFPVRGLNLREWVKNEHYGSAVYDLIAVSNHMGGLGGGHYTAYAVNQHEGRKWFDFNDSHVDELRGGDDVVEQEITSKSAYVLFYRRRDQPQLIEASVEPNIEMETDD